MNEKERIEATYNSVKEISRQMPESAIVLFLMSVKELSSEITIGVGIFTKQDFEQFFLDIKWFDQICPGFIRYQE
jgi:hypothetical protein